MVVIPLNHGNYCLNGDFLKGINTLMIKSLEMSGYIVIPIAIHRWMQLDDYEKIPYLMKTIHEKCDSLEQLHAEG